MAAFYVCRDCSDIRFDNIKSEIKGSPQKIVDGKAACCVCGEMMRARLMYGYDYPITLAEKLITGLKKSVWITQLLRAVRQV